MRQELNDGLALIFQGIEQMRKAFPSRAFTIDGRLVGDVGEIIAELEYDLTLDKVSRPGHDAACGKRLVQIKATFKNSLTFSSCPEYYLGFKLFPNGDHKEVFNGPGHLIMERFAKRRHIGERLLSFPIRELEALSAKVPESERIPRRENPRAPTT